MVQLFLGHPVVGTMVKQERGFLWHELEGQTQLGILSWGSRQGANQGAYDVVLTPQNVNLCIPQRMNE